MAAGRLVLRPLSTERWPLALEHGVAPLLHRPLRWPPVYSSLRNMGQYRSLTTWPVRRPVVIAAPATSHLGAGRVERTDGLRAARTTL